MTAWLAPLAVYRDRRMLAILLMGFASGLPLALTASTLAIWLKEAGISLAAISLFAPVGLAYNLKFLWSPVFDGATVPGLTRWLGRRRSWAITIQAGLLLALLALGASDPAGAIWRVALLASLVAFLSASQDIVIDAYRVELLSDPEQGAGAAATQIGYRFGMIASSAGALYLAQFFGWFWAYAGMAGLVLVGMVTVLMTREPAVPAPRPGARRGRALVEPFLDFARRPAWVAILVFVLLYKFGDALAGSGYVTGPLYLALHFTKVEIANITKVLGVAASIGGVVLGGMVVYRAGVMGALLICGILQMLSNLMYVVQLWAGHDLAVLALTISVENVTGGMSSAAFVAYLSRLCSPGFTATQYALLSAVAALARTVFASAGGELVEQLGWAPFFFLATAACLPGLLLLLWLMRRSPVAPENPALAA